MEPLSRLLNSSTPKSENLSLTVYAANPGDKKRYRAKTPSTQRKILNYFSEPWRPLRLCARRCFSISFQFRISNPFGQSLGKRLLCFQTPLFPPKFFGMFWDMDR
jgi:hypothetical protein